MQVHSVWLTDSLKLLLADFYLPLGFTDFGEGSLDQLQEKKFAKFEFGLGYTRRSNCRVAKLGFLYSLIKDLLLASPLAYDYDAQLLQFVYHFHCLCLLLCEAIQWNAFNREPTIY